MSPLVVFCVEQHALFLGVVLRFLHELGNAELRALGTPSPAAALDLAPVVQPHIVLLGLGASVHDDFGLIADLRRRMPDVSIIALGLIDLDEYRAAAQAAGADAFVPKAQLAHDLRHVMQQVHQRRSSANDMRAGCRLEQHDVGI